MEATKTPAAITSPNDGGEAGTIVTLNENVADVHAITAQTLPQYVIIQSSFSIRYLRLSTENPAVTGALRFDENYSYDLNTRFEVVPATNGTGFVHIRSLQNNKYWTNFDETKNSFVTAMAVKPEEDQSAKHCTLFQPIFERPYNNRVLSLRHVSTGYYAAFFTDSGDSYGMLYLSRFSNFDMCDFLDWESIVMLPDLIRIKCVKNGNHLKALEDGYMDYNNKADNSSLFDFEVSPGHDGGIRLKSTSYGKYWMDMDNSDWVLLMQDSSSAFEDTRTVFFPTIVDGNRIIMRSSQSNQYCNMYSKDNKENCLATLNNYPDDWSYMEIEEPIMSRKIENVEYHLSYARLYNEKNVALISDDSSNNTPNDLTSELNLKTVVSNTTNWSTSVSLTVGARMSITFGVPFIKSISGEIEISGDVTKSSEWGETVTESHEVGSVKTITVPAMTRIKASLMATRISYDIPFSYTQRDVLKNGSTKVTVKNDGFFTGHNGYGYRYEVVQLPLE